ncbi:hypothetical protein GCM10020255_032780 [Rhodococcus baikonurensis]
MTEQLGRQSTSTDLKSDDHTFASLDPRNDSVVAQHPIADQQAIEKAVAAARTASKWWDQLGFQGRRKVLGNFRAAIATHAESMAAIISAETESPATTHYSKSCWPSNTSTGRHATPRKCCAADASAQD